MARDRRRGAEPWADSHRGWDASRGAEELKRKLRSGQADAPQMHLQDVLGNRGVQRLMDSLAKNRRQDAGEPSARQAHAAALEGTRGAGGALPHVEAIQRSFGRHDVSRVQAHVGGMAEKASDAMDASAFTVGLHVGFARAPSLRTAAHEAAHAVQQQAGVQLEGGLGKADDRYEQHADAVADRVVRGESSEALLDQMAPRGKAVGAGGVAVQRAPKWADVYGKDPETEAQQFKQSLTTATGNEKLRPAKEWTSAQGQHGTWAGTFGLSRAQILEVIAAAQGPKGVNAALGAPGSPERAAHEDQIANYVMKMTEAFEIMEIDTLEAQAAIVAHAIGESLFANLTEGQTQKFIDDPAKAKVTTSLDPEPGKTVIAGPRRYMGNRLIDPLGVITQSGPMDPSLFRKTFIGRGPIQVTDRTNYLHSLMFLELRADELQKELDALPVTEQDRRKELGDQVALLRKAVAEIQADPSQAANPDYAFLLSAALLQSSPVLKSSIAGFGPTRDFTRSPGFGGGHKDNRGEVKTRAYAKAYELLKDNLDRFQKMFSSNLPIYKPTWKNLPTYSFSLRQPW